MDRKSEFQELVELPDVPALCSYSDWNKYLYAEEKGKLSIISRGKDLEAL
jgi:hypothetical protein